MGRANGLPLRLLRQRQRLSLWCPPLCPKMQAQLLWKLLGRSLCKAMPAMQSLGKKSSSSSSSSSSSRNSRTTKHTKRQPLLLV